MLNLAPFIKLKKHRTLKSNGFINELNICLKSFDFEHKETCRFILCHMSNLLFFEYKINKFNGAVDCCQETLRIFVNKLLNLDSMCKELACLCLSLIGPIDFQTYHLPISKMNKYDGCLSFNKTFTNLRDYSENIPTERRLFILQNLANYSNTHVFQFYYFLIEKLVELLNGHK
jgi:hypothetical protein